MLPVLSGRRALLVVLAVLAAVAIASPGWAQSTGMLKGKVVDGENKPVDGAKVSISFLDGISRSYEVKTNKKGEFIQIGLPPGRYKVTAEKEKLGSQSFDARVRLGDAAEVNFALVPGSVGLTKEDAAKAEAVKTLFEEGVAASRSNDYDTALAKFNEAITLLPSCYDCYYNIGFAQAQKKEYDKAEESFKKAIELKADYVEAYNGLATVYNAQKRFDDAQAASQKAAELASAGGATGGGGGVDALYNQGVIAWNAGKAEDAKKHFEEAIKLNPQHADSHYQLGMCYVNLGNLAEAAGMFEKYLTLAPEGQYAEQAKALVTQLKK
ncbi:MAG TPA: tetratricopeptide repeat protein [Vicinamibacterales bacterium]|nr:tetratricopeptide repeat protein [Acidobacteriota bacterium]HOC16907.1 tetratricopeptide repeat protein [Vicinamibacterales bacterium]